MFALAIIVWELVNRLITGEYARPYEEHPELQFDYQIIIQTAKHGLRPTLHTSTPEPLRQLMENGWAADPSNDIILFCFRFWFFFDFFLKKLFFVFCF